MIKKIYEMVTYEPKTDDYFEFMDLPMTRFEKIALAVAFVVLIITVKVVL